MTNKKKLILVSSQAIDQRNLNRFQLEYLNENFDFEFWDISEIHSRTKLIQDENKIISNIKTLNLKKKKIYLKSI